MIDIPKTLEWILKQFARVKVIYKNRECSIILKLRKWIFLFYIFFGIIVLLCFIFQGVKQKIPSHYKVLNCLCPQTCSEKILDQYVGTLKSGRRFTCRECIKKFMRNYVVSQRSACIEVAKHYPVCGNGCNPDQCFLKPSNNIEKPDVQKTIESSFAGKLIQSSDEGKSEEEESSSSQHPGIHQHPETIIQKLSSDIVEKIIPKDKEYSQNKPAIQISSSDSEVIIDHDIGDEVTCKQRINYLMKNYDESHRDACAEVAKRNPVCMDTCESSFIREKPVSRYEEPSLSQHPVTIGQKISSDSEVLNCSCPLTCNDDILDQYAGTLKLSGRSFTCRQWIYYLMSIHDESERSACVKAVKKYPACGNGCNPEKCSWIKK